MNIKSITIKAAGCLALALSLNAQAQIDYGYMYPPILPNEQSMNDLPYAIPCEEANNQYGAKLYSCTRYSIPRNLTQWDAHQQRNITFSNHISGKCVRGTCGASNSLGIYGMYGQDLSFSLYIYYYIYENENNYPAAYRMDRWTK